MTTARQIVRRSLQKIGVLTKTEQPSADEANDGLAELNAMLSSWATESLLITSRQIETFPLQSGVGQYLIGQGQIFDTQRPNEIVSAVIRWATTDHDLSIVTDEVFERYIQSKATQGLPKFLNYDNAYPFGTIKLWPVPSSDYALRIMSEKTIASFTLDDVVNLPPGWEDALVYNLGIRQAPEYGVDVSDTHALTARETKGNIKRAILKARPMDALPQQRISAGNIYSGYNT